MIRYTLLLMREPDGEETDAVEVSRYEGLNPEKLRIGMGGRTQVSTWAANCVTNNALRYQEDRRFRVCKLLQQMEDLKKELDSLGVKGNTQ